MFVFLSHVTKRVSVHLEGNTGSGLRNCLALPRPRVSRNGSLGRHFYCILQCFLSKALTCHLSDYLPWAMQIDKF